MRTKSILRVTAIMLCVFVGTNNVKAQTHKKAAPNCIMHDDYVKAASKTKNAVSCVDCYCKICGDKKQKEKEAKLNQAEAANKQKNTTPQKKTTTKTTTKAKSNEAILVAPKPNKTKNELNSLSTEDKNIYNTYDNLNDKDKIIIAYSIDDSELVKLQYPEIVTNVGRIFIRDFDDLENKFIFTLLKDNYNINSTLPITSYEGELNDSFKQVGLFIVHFNNNQKIFWSDLVDLNGNCVFGNTEYFDVTYDKDSKTFKLEKQGTGLYGAGKFTEEYNPVTKEITPIN